MKSIIKTMLLATATVISLAGYAQDTLKVNPDPEIKKAAKKVGDKTAEIAVKGAAKVVDQTYKDKVGPQGQTIYIDNRSKYYYINTEGKKIYVKKSQLKDKPNP